MTGVPRIMYQFLLTPKSNVSDGDIRLFAYLTVLKDNRFLLNVSLAMDPSFLILKRDNEGGLDKVHDKADPSSLC